MKIRRIMFLTLATLSLAFASCGSDEPEWADPEAHEKTEQLRAQYTPFIAGTWHYETICRQLAEQRRLDNLRTWRGRTEFLR